MTINGAITQLVMMTETSMMPNIFRPALNKVIETISELEPEPHWIPCSERLPEDDGKYLCCWQGISVGTGMFLNGYFRLYGEIKDNLVTAWQPLPSPYREEADE